MKVFKYLSAAASAVLAVSGITGCQDKFDEVEPAAPKAELESNISILEFKQLFWDDASTDYCTEIPAREDGTHYVIKGRVISSDRQGNVFKCLYIQDGSAALPMSINQYNLYLTHRIGQEVVIDVTGMYAGRYSGMFELGAPSWSTYSNCITTGFMPPELFRQHAQANGNPAEVDTITVGSYSDIDDLAKWQGQMVRFNNATFANATNTADNQFCNEFHSSGYDQVLNVNGGSIKVRTSGYSKFWNAKLPAQACDVAGILGYYGSSGWQLYLNDLGGIINEGNPTVQGTVEKPYGIEEAIALAATGTSASGWVKGYIVGTVAPEVTEVTSNADISWTGPFVMDNTLVLAAEPTERDYTKCMVLTLNEGSELYSLANLADNSERLGAWLNVQGRFSTMMGMAAVTGNPGTAASFRMEGVEYEDPTIKSGDGSESAPYNVEQVIGLGNPGTTAWVSGYIVGVINYDNKSSFENTLPTTVVVCIAIAGTPDETDKNNMVAVQLPPGSVRTALNLVDHPENMGRKVSVEGSLMSYFGIAGVKSTSAYKLQGEGGGDTPTPPAPDGGTKEKPYTIDQVLAIGANGTTAWTEGYIVGWSTNGSFAANFTAGPEANAANVLLAATAGETDAAKVVPLKLASGSAIRAALNLKDNPSNLGKKLLVQGKLDSFFNRTGILDAAEFELK